MYNSCFFFFPCLSCIVRRVIASTASSERFFRFHIITSSHHFLARTHILHSNGSYQNVSFNGFNIFGNRPYKLDHVLFLAAISLSYVSIKIKMIVPLSGGITFMVRSMYCLISRQEKRPRSGPRQRLSRIVPVPQTRLPSIVAVLRNLLLTRSVRPVTSSISRRLQTNRSRECTWYKREAIKRIQIQKNTSAGKKNIPYPENQNPTYLNKIQHVPYPTRACHQPLPGGKRSP